MVRDERFQGQSQGGGGETGAGASVIWSFDCKGS